MTATTVPAELPISEARAILTDIATAAKEHGAKTILTKHGKPVAQIGPITCHLCSEPIVPTASGAGWVDAEGWDHCPDTSDSHRPAKETP
jgi:antitoxin (DNA-binding transcriptional repressor) of toxin-antitoxin stability system